MLRLERVPGSDAKMDVRGKLTFYFAIEGNTGMVLTAAEQTEIRSRETRAHGNATGR
jgi:hypothetical protein